MLASRFADSFIIPKPPVSDENKYLEDVAKDLIENANATIGEVDVIN